MVVWLHTSHVDDVEIVEAYLQKHEFDIGVVPKPVEKIDLAMALLILTKVLYFLMFKSDLSFIFRKSHNALERSEL
jgi:hypothetical protein